MKRRKKQQLDNHISFSTLGIFLPVANVSTAVFYIDNLHGTNIAVLISFIRSTFVLLHNPMFYHYY